MDKSKNTQEYSYLSTFKEDDMKVLLDEYTKYHKQSNFIRVPGFLMLGVIGVFRFTEGSLPKNVLNAIAVVAILGLLAWVIYLGFALYKQKKLLNNRLEIMSREQDYKIKVVKREFNMLVKNVYSGPSI